MKATAIGNHPLSSEAMFPTYSNSGDNCTRYNVVTILCQARLCFRQLFPHNFSAVYSGKEADHWVIRRLTIPFG